MALEIKPTPVLKGASAERFLKIIAENEKRVAEPGKKEERAKLVATILQKAKI